MKVLVLGSGAREHALAWKLAGSTHVEEVFCGPGNGGTIDVATNIREIDPLAFDTVAAACGRHGIDCVLVGPETPLAAGVVDFLGERGVPVVGPGSPAARLESSKAFSKSFMTRHSLPTAAAEEIADAAALEQRLRASPGARLVIKKSGLAGGKGVLESSDPDRLLEFGRGILPHDRLLVEEYLEGWEVSVFGLSDGRSHVVLPPCADFKKAGEADTGPNTGGMGAICPVPWVTPELMDRIIGEVVEPTYAALRAENLDYAGVLYFGLMITPSGPRILEFNVRFGDPETQVLMPMLPFDLGEAIAAIADRSLAGLRLPGTGTPSQEHGGALGVVVASRGYPESSEKGTLVKSLPTPEEGGALLFHASTTMDSNGDIRTGGGRCFTVVGLGEDLRRAGEHAYAAASRVRFGGAWFRRDIGRKFMEDRP